MCVLEPGNHSVKLSAVQAFNISTFYQKQSAFQQQKMKFSLFLTFLIAAKVISVAYCRDFSYLGPDGPENWAKEYSNCNGKHQSPINIEFLNVVKKPFETLDLEAFYQRPLEANITNNGHTVVVNFKFLRVPTITKGPLYNDVYAFAQLHFHWGPNSLVGSEDRINGKQFAAELHMVFYNTAYESFNEAIKHKNGAAVLALFFEVVQDSRNYITNPTYEALTLQLEHIKTRNTTVPFPNPPALTYFMSSMFQTYYTYIGSLTTPPCSEDVIWIDYSIPIMVTETQLERFRHLVDLDGVPLSQNYRPLQPLNNRTIYEVAPGADSAIPFIKSAAADGRKPLNIYHFIASLCVLAIFNFQMNN